MIPSWSAGSVCGFIWSKSLLVSLQWNEESLSREEPWLQPTGCVRLPPVPRVSPLFQAVHDRLRVPLHRLLAADPGSPSLTGVPSPLRSELGRLLLSDGDATTALATPSVLPPARALPPEAGAVDVAVRRPQRFRHSPAVPLLPPEKGLRVCGDDHLHPARPPVLAEPSRHGGRDGGGDASSPPRLQSPPGHHRHVLGRSRVCPFSLRQRVQ